MVICLKAIDELLDLVENSSRYQIYSRFLNETFKNKKNLFKYGKSFEDYSKEYGLVVDDYLYVGYNYLLKSTEKITFTFYNVYFDNYIITSLSDMIKYNM